MKHNIVETVLWSIFLAVGLTIVIAGIIVCINVMDYDGTEETTATISSISSYTSGGEKKHRVTVKYTVGDKEYSSRLGSYSSSFYEGKEIEIYYRLDDPTDIGMKKMDRLFLMLPGFGLVFASAGAIGLLFILRNKMRERWLIEHGTLIKAQYVETRINNTYYVNGKHPYNVVCSWESPYDKKTYLFRSKNTFVDPRPLIEEKGVTSFPVYIDLDNKKHYVVDIEGLYENVVDLT